MGGMAALKTAWVRTQWSKGMERSQWAQEIFISNIAGIPYTAKLGTWEQKGKIQVQKDKYFYFHHMSSYFQLGGLKFSLKCFVQRGGQCDFFLPKVDKRSTMNLNCVTILQIYEFDLHEETTCSFEFQCFPLSLNWHLQIRSGLGKMSELPGRVIFTELLICSN